MATRCASGSRSTARRTSSLSRRSEEHTSELQSRQYLVCRLLLEKKKEYTIDCRLPPLAAQECQRIRDKRRGQLAVHLPEITPQHDPQLRSQHRPAQVNVHKHRIL